MGRAQSTLNNTKDQTSQPPRGRQLEAGDQEDSRLSSSADNRRQTRRQKYNNELALQNDDVDMKSTSSNANSTRGRDKEKERDRGSHEGKKHKKKKDKKKKKKKDKKKKDKKKKDKKKKKKRSGSSSSDSSNSSDDSDEDWKFEDKGVNYGSPERVTDGSSLWDGRSQELYDSDNPDCPLNLYHLESKPRLIEIQHHNEEGDPVVLQLDFMTLKEDDLAGSSLKDKENKTHSEKKKEFEYKQNFVDHREFQNFDMSYLPRNDFQSRHIQNLFAQILPGMYRILQQIGQLRQDKNIQAMLETLKYDFIKLQKQEELENAEIRRKIILEQKQLKEKKEKQKRVFTNEMRRKGPESMEEKKERLNKERIEQGLPPPKPKKPQGSAGFGGAEGGVDTNHVIRMIEQKKQNLKDILKPVDIEIVLTHEIEQNNLYPTMIKRIRLKAHRSVTLVHLGILVAHKNSCKEDEWPNFEFYPGRSFHEYVNKNPHHQSNYKHNNRPFRFRMSVQEIIKELYNEKDDKLTTIDLIYKKKQLPNMNPKLQQQEMQNKYGFMANDMKKDEQFSSLNGGGSGIFGGNDEKIKNEDYNEGNTLGRASAAIGMGGSSFVGALKNTGYNNGQF
eukprot:403362870